MLSGARRQPRRSSIGAPLKSTDRSSEGLAATPGTVAIALIAKLRHWERDGTLQRLGEALWPSRLVPGVLRLDRSDDRWKRFLRRLRPCHHRREIDKCAMVFGRLDLSLEFTGFEMFAPLVSRMAGSGASGIQPWRVLLSAGRAGTTREYSWHIRINRSVAGENASGWGCAQQRIAQRPARFVSPLSRVPRLSEQLLRRRAQGLSVHD